MYNYDYNEYGLSKQQKDTKVYEPYEYKYLNPDQLRERCFASIEDYKSEGEVTKTPAGVYYYKDNGAQILAVAHLDTVQALKKFVPVEGGAKIYNPQLDDRLGAYSILDLLPTLGLKYDILLTEGEETGNSTARFFTPPEGKEYLWMFEIDRMGNDVVAYKYESDKLVKRLQSVGCRVGVGSFTDISVLDKLGCQGVNFGCGYYNNHSTEAYFLVKEYEAQIEKVVAFYEKYKDTKLVYDPKLGIYGRKSYVTTGYNYQNRWNDYQEGYTRTCKNCYCIPCQCPKQLVTTNNYCSQCGALKLGKYCDDYCELFDGQCSICDNLDCKGLKQCEICTFLFHDNPFVTAFGMCADCLEDFMVLPPILLAKYKVFLDKETEDEIKELLYK